MLFSSDDTTSWGRERIRGSKKANSTGGDGALAYTCEGLSQLMARELSCLRESIPVSGQAPCLADCINASYFSSEGIQFTFGGKVAPGWISFASGFGSEAVESRR